MKEIEILVEVYDDIIINKKTNTIFEFIYGEQNDVVDIENNIYKSQGRTYKCTVIY